jgi:uncharacterized protein (TIGR03083 family)
METAEAYRLVRGRMLDLAGGADPATPVPTCPGWTVKELLSHVSGVAGDVLSGNIAEAGTEPWVAVQVEARADRAFDDVLAEWQTAGPQVDELCVALGDGIAQLIFDTVTHEQDLRGALGQPGGEDGAVEVALRWAAGTWGDQEAPTSGSLCIRAGAVEAVRGGGDPVVGVDLGSLDALQVLTGRRSLTEVRACPWDGDVEPWLPAFTWGPFVPAP